MKDEEAVVLVRSPWCAGGRGEEYSTGEGINHS